MFYKETEPGTAPALPSLDPDMAGTPTRPGPGLCAVIRPPPLTPGGRDELRSSGPGALSRLLGHSTQSVMLRANDLRNKTFRDNSSAPKTTN